MADLSTPDEIHEAARRWLVTYDPEGAATWLSAGPDADLVMDVVQNLTTFGLADPEGDEEAAQEGLEIVAASHRLRLAGTPITRAQDDQARRGLRDAYSMVRDGVRMLVESLYRETARKPEAILLRLPADLWRDVAVAARGHSGGEVYRAGGEMCVDVMTPIGRVTCTEGR